MKEQKGKQELSGEMRPLQGAEAFAVCDAIWELLNKTWTSWTADQQSFQIFTNSSSVIFFCTYSTVLIIVFELQGLNVKTKKYIAYQNKTTNFTYQML